MCELVDSGLSFWNLLYNEAPNAYQGQRDSESTHSPVFGLRGN